MPNYFAGAWLLQHPRSPHRSDCQDQKHNPGRRSDDTGMGWELYLGSASCKIPFGSLSVELFEHNVSYMFEACLG